MTRAETLARAANYVTGERQTDYGAVENNFGTIARFWMNYLNAIDENNVYISAHDVAAMMALLKIARITNSASKSDNWIDLAGYAACGAECVSTEKAGICAGECDE